jgi:hypothetical protein
MPRRSQARSLASGRRSRPWGIWWIRYRENGALHGEKVGRKSDALALYQKRKSEIRAGAKLPENMRRASIRFGQLAEDIRRYSEKHHRDQGRIQSRLKRILPDFENRLWIFGEFDLLFIKNRPRVLADLTSSVGCPRGDRQSSRGVGVVEM